MLFVQLARDAIQMNVEPSHHIMINLSLVSLAISSISRSPLLATDSCTRIINSCFSNHFSTMFFTHSYSHLVKNTKFNNILSTSIVLDNSNNDYSKEKITKRINQQDIDGKFIVSQCLFINCKSDDNGAALCISSEYDLTVEIEKTGFTSCKTEGKGGSFYLDVAKLLVSSCCFDDCSANSNSLFITKVDQCAFSDNYFSNIQTQQSKSNMAEIDCIGDLEFFNSNFTKNEATKATGIVHFITNKLAFKEAIFESNKAKSIFSLKGRHLNTQYLFHINFVKNSGTEYLLNVEQTSTFDKCSFMKDKSDKIASTYSIFQNCLFSDKDPNFGRIVYTSACNVNVDFQTFEIEINPSKYCWMLNSKTKTKPKQPDDDPVDEEKSSTEKAAIGVSTVLAIFVVVVVIVLGYLYCKNKKRNADKDFLLMYSNI